MLENVQVHERGCICYWLQTLLQWGEKSGKKRVFARIECLLIFKS